MKLRTITTALLGTSAMALGFATAPAFSAAHTEPVTACLITKTDINPFFVKMKEGATAKAEELGIELLTFAGKVDGDHEAQVQAIESCIAAGAKGILITASDTSAIVENVRQARDQGVLVIALDTPLSPIDAADATFATDNFLAGELIGRYAAAKLGDDAANARIALLNLNRESAHGRRAAKPGLPDRLRHRCRRSQSLGRRGRPAHRRPRHHVGQ